jgi:hypothetical protein
MVVHSCCTQDVNNVYEGVLIITWNSGLNNLRFKVLDSGILI